MVEISTEKGLMVQKVGLENGEITFGFLEREYYLERSREADFESYITTCRDLVDCLLVVSSFTECKEVCEKLRSLLDESNLINLDVADLCFVAGKGDICTVGRSTCTDRSLLNEEVCALLEKTYAKQDRKKTAVLLALEGDIEFLEATEAAGKLSEKLDTNADIIFGIQEAEKQGEINILLLVTEKKVAE